MTEQPEALRLANLLETDGWPDAAAELRRLHDLLGKANALNRIRTAPSSNRKWVGLTDEERFEVADISDCFEDVVDAVEAKLKEKNT